MRSIGAKWCEVETQRSSFRDCANAFGAAGEAMARLAYFVPADEETEHRYLSFSPWYPENEVEFFAKLFTSFGPNNEKDKATPAGAEEREQASSEELDDFLSGFNIVEDCK